ncbi:Spy/CpxP family protein refolding chaperone [Bradyrhizobium yuanmingense]|uniref:Spy/CpxP family protein refolding chaperone n=1 Tax=Bradyrhizobium yuanmingense TaxID=108015 RepID=UPI003513835A
MAATSLGHHSFQGVERRALKSAKGHSRRVGPAASPSNVRSAAESGSQFRGAMLTAAKLVEPALDEFYATLSSEQKARFNTLQQVASP